MNYTTFMKRREETSALAKEFVEKAMKRSQECSRSGEIEWAFVAGYLESAIANLATVSPAAVRELKSMVK